MSASGCCNDERYGEKNKKIEGEGKLTTNAQTIQYPNLILLDN